MGEGPFWSAVEGALWFVDILSERIHRFDPLTGGGRSWSAPGKVSFVLPGETGGLVVGLPGVIVQFQPETGNFDTLARVEDNYPGNRLNDACVDGGGCLWFGTMDDAAKAKTGALYRWGDEAAPVQVDSGYCISNGPAFSPDGRHLYVTDTLDRVIYRFEVDAGGRLHGKTLFIRFTAADGHPDGTTIDAEGHLWVAFYGGWAVRRISPDGTLIGTVTLPCANVTKLAFGGDGLKTAFVTTARDGLSDDALREQPLAGNLFAFDVDVPGLPQALCSRTARG